MKKIRWWDCAERTRVLGTWLVGGGWVAAAWLRSAVRFGCPRTTGPRRRGAEAGDERTQYPPADLLHRSPSRP